MNQRVYEYDPIEKLINEVIECNGDRAEMKRLIKEFVDKTILGKAS